MVEYRVNALYYRFRSLRIRDTYDTAESVSGALDGWSYTLEAGLLTARPVAEYRDRDEARQAFEPLLRDWEQATFLSDLRSRVAFEYERSDVEAIDPPPNAIYVFAELAVGHATVFTPTVVRSGPYPSPSPAFKGSALTARLIDRLRRVQDGVAEFPAIYNYVLTALEKRFGTRRGVADALQVSMPVLDRLGALLKRGDPEVGRDARGDETPFSPEERAYIEAVVYCLVRRLGEYQGGSPLQLLTKADFPP